MDKRTFFQTTTLASLGALIVPASLLKSRLRVEIDYARRIIYVNRSPSTVGTKTLHNAVMSIWDPMIGGISFVQRRDCRDYLMDGNFEEAWDNDDPSKLNIKYPDKIRFLYNEPPDFFL